MPRMTRSSIKREPAPELPGNPVAIRQPSSRPQTISASTTPTPEHYNMSSGSTTIPDGDVTIAEDAAVYSSVNTPAAGAQDVLAKLGSSSRALIQAIDNIAGLGLKAQLPDLPQFSIVGDQSAGKSSVIESLCNITLPRSEGTTTRCPFLITTTATTSAAAHPWTCTISLDHRFDYDPSATGSEHTFKHWRERGVPEKQQLTVLYDKSKLEEELKLAQLRILNPGQNPSSFHRKSSNQRTQVPFSPNVVTFRIESPELLDLSFYDLPGLITYHEGEEDQYDAVVDFVGALATHYMRNPKGLVLFACAASQDLETSLTLAKIKGAKATGRCIGVITKPDLVPSSDFVPPQIQAILAGRKIRLSGGWFVTRQSSRDEIARGITYEQAREREQDFFDQVPWLTSPFAGQFGIRSLQVYIAEQLRMHIIGQLPGIDQTLQNQMGHVKEQLGTFPEQDGHPIATVAAEIQSVASKIKSELGDRSRVTFRKDYNGALARFEESLEKNAPQIFLRTPQNLINLIDSDDEDGGTAPSSAPTPTPARFTTPSSSRKRPLTGGSQPSSAVKRPKAKPGTPQTLPRPVFTLDFVRNEYREGCASGIPGERQPEVTDRLSLAAIKRWEPLVVALLKEIDAGTQACITQSITQVLSAREHTGLFRSILQATKNLATEALRQQQGRIMFSLAAEQHATWTSDSMEHQRDEFNQRLHSGRMKNRINEFFDQKQKVTGNVVEKADREAKLADAKWQATNLAKDLWQEEVDALVKPLAYYQLACRRFQETIKSGLEFGFVNEICKLLADRLRNELGANDLDRCRELLAEHPERERERQVLLSEQGKLEAAIAELATLSVTREV